ncbi:MAG: radical SAM protein [Candidatus Eisenbacteria bacterium]
MDRIRFTLINPTAPLWRARERGRGLGPRVFRFSMLPSLYVAASMPPDVETRIVDEDVEPIDFGDDVDLVGISLMTFNAPRAYEVADRFRARGVPVILGGYHPTFLPEEALAHADAVCVGEAEANVPAMMEDFRGGRLRGVYESDPIDLANVPSPDRSLVKKRAYISGNVVQATRGCPYRCRFCSVSAFHRYQIRTRPVPQVIEELKTVGRHVLFMDDSLISDREYAKELFAAMIPLGKTWFSQCSSQIANDPTLLELAARSGCRGLFVGFESLSQSNLDRWSKGRSRAKDYTETVRRLHAAGIGVCAGIVFGGDDDGEDVFPRTLEFLLDANVDALQATRLTPFPGTPLFTDMERDGRIFDHDWSHYDFSNVVFQPAHMTPKTLDQGTAWVLRHFYSRREIARRFWRERSYIGRSAFTRAVLPLNLGYRTRLGKNGTFARGGRYTPPTARPRNKS